MVSIMTSDWSNPSEKVRSSNINQTQADSRNMIAGLYDLGETIGEGHYAVVKLARQGEYLTENEEKIGVLCKFLLRTPFFDL